MTGGKPFADVARQRSQLGRAMLQVETTAAAPAGKDSWLSDLRNSLRQLEIAFDSHVAEVEAPMGLLDGIMERSPRLQRAVELTKRDHESITQTLTTTLESIAVGDRDDDAIRDRVLSLLLALSRHRQKGADLIYDAYDIDIGGY